MRMALPVNGEAHRRCRVAFVLPGLHRINRGAEVALEQIARHLARRPGWDVTVIGAGRARAAEPYRFFRAPCVHRKWMPPPPPIPGLRDQYMLEELTFLPSLAFRYHPQAYDLTVTCGYPYTNWLLTGRRHRRGRPAHVYITQNGDWPAYENKREFRYFRCDGIVCTNPQYYRRVGDRWPATLIPNGVDPNQFAPGPAERSRLELPRDAPIALMVSALHPSKRVIEGIRAVKRVPGLHLVVAGDGPMRAQVQQVGKSELKQRFHWMTLPREWMPALYRSADLFLHMSLDEPSANAYIEALATGLPIVTHDREVTRWTLEETGILVDTTQRALVASAIEKGLERNSEAEVQRRRELVERRFTWEAIADRYATFFEHVRQTHTGADKPTHVGAGHDE